MMTSQTIVLPDGRVLSYAEYGDPAGHPLLYFHGTPGSRLDWYLVDPDNTLARDRKLRVLAPDRPGAGDSGFQSRRRITDWAADVRQFADELGIDRFRVIGLSGGGPYALAVAHAMPERVVRGAIISGVGPLDVPGVTRGMGPGKHIFRLARWLPFVVNFQYAMMRRGLESDPQMLMKQVAASIPDADRMMLAEPDAQQAFLNTLAEAMRHGPRGVTYESGLLAGRWGFPLADIRVPLDLWYGSVDRNVPTAMGRYLADQMACAEWHAVEGEGHFSLGGKYMAQILDRVAAVI